MIELVLVIALIVAMCKIAEVEEQSPILWGAATFVICALCMLIPFPYARVLIAGVAAIAAMTTYKMVRK